MWCEFFIYHTFGAIPRACSTPETSKFPFCDTSKSLDERIKDLISRIQLEEKPYLLTARESPKGNISRLGLPEYDWGTNCIHGVQSRCGTHCPTSFPNPNGLGATFNRTLYRSIGAIIGMELRALWLEGVGENHPNNLPHLGLDCWSPNINILRDPRWGRALETTGEDPYLNGVFGAEYTIGLQNGSASTVQDPRYLQAIVTLKHWDAYSLEGKWGDNGNITRHNFNAKISEFDFQSTYWPAFKQSVVRGGARGVMCSYNEVNGVPSCANPKLYDVLRNQWGFEGYVTSDSGAVTDIYTPHNYSSTLAEASIQAISAGCDVDSCLGKGCGGDDKSDMTSSPYMETLVESVKKGDIKESVIDDALYRTLKLRFQLGLFDPIEDQPYWHVSPDVVASKAHNQTSLDATRQSMTLIQNPNAMLPFSKDLNIALLGPHINSKYDLLGNYIGEFCFGGFDCLETPAEAIEKLSSGKVEALTGCKDVICKSDDEFDDALDAAKAADAIVMIMGLNTALIERESMDRKSLTLPGRQMDFIQQCLSLNKSIALVLMNGGPVSLDEIVGKNIAILEAFYPSQFGAQAIAETIYGLNNPSGKLPFSIYASDYVTEVDFLNHNMVNDVGRTYRYYRGKHEQFVFGHGLSYSQFSFQHKASGNVITVAVTNKGPLEGSEVVQVYMKPQMEKRFEDLNVAFLRKQLIDFDRLNDLAVGGTKALTFALQWDAFTLYDNDGKEIFAHHYEVILENGNDWTESVICSANSHSKWISCDSRTYI